MGPLTKPGNKTMKEGNGRFKETARRENYRCSECDEFDLKKKFSGVAGTPGKREYDRIKAPNNCPVCGGEMTIQTQDNVTKQK